MAILGIGVDLVHIPRIAALISRRTEAKFAAKILSQAEYAQWDALRRSALTSPRATGVGGGGVETVEGSQNENESKASEVSRAMRPELETARVRFLAVRCSPPASIQISFSSCSPSYECLFQYDSLRIFQNQHRWSVKEAAYKAMYPHARATWKELSYTGLMATSKPRVEYHPILSSPDRKGNPVGKLHVSVSHDGEYVYSSVLAEGAS